MKNMMIMIKNLITAETKINIMKMRKEITMNKNKRIKKYKMNLTKISKISENKRRSTHKMMGVAEVCKES